jgi:hypothetical protein
MNTVSNKIEQFLNWDSSLFPLAFASLGLALTAVVVFISSVVGA